MVIIVGAGLSGLLTAYRLKNEGIPFKILEARSRIGGRILTVFGTSETPVEMGATWLQTHHENLVALLEELQIPIFEQKMDNAVYYQRSPTSEIETIEIPTQPPSYRIAGGTSHLINSLYEKLNKSDVVLKQQVIKIKYKENKFQVFANDVFEAEQVVLALPPKLWAKKVVFQPELPNNISKIAKETHTWMEDSIKIALTYSSPFWQENNLYGTFYSNSGPITEFYDHCNIERNKFALCGFISSHCKTWSDAERKAAVLEQLLNVFGNKASNYLEYEECLWSNETHTFQATEAPLFPHQNNGNPIFNQLFFDDKLYISSAEVALKSPGYMDGAVFSGNEIAKKIIKSVETLK